MGSRIILIADDDPDDRDLLIEAIGQTDPDIRCVTACNGQEALKMLEQPDLEVPDYIFLDLNMPRLDGAQCLAEIKKSERLLNIPVIIYTTARLDEESLIALQKLGAAYFLIKPNTFDQLRDSLSGIIEESRNKNTNGKLNSLG